MDNKKLDTMNEPTTVADVLSVLEKDFDISKQRIDELRMSIATRNKIHTTLSEVLLDIDNMDITDDERRVVLFEYGVAWMTNVVRSQNERQTIH